MFNNILETAPETCFYIEGESGDRYTIGKKTRKRRAKKVTEYAGAKVKPSAEEIQRRIAEYSALVAQEIPLPVLPEFKDCFDDSED